MDRARRWMPVSNAITHKRQVQRRQDLHREKLRQMESTVDTSLPKTYQLPHLRRNLKKAQLMEERYTAIERENRLLLEKMSYIMHHQMVDNKNESRKYVRSLNVEHRKRELSKITSENQVILRRIQQSRATYDHQEWEDDFRANAEYARNICEYEYKLSMQPGRRKAGDPRSPSRVSPSPALRPRTRDATAHSPSHAAYGRMLASAPAAAHDSGGAGKDVLLYHERAPLRSEDPAAAAAAAAAGAEDDTWDVTLLDVGATTVTQEDATAALAVHLRSSEGDEQELYLTVDQLKELCADSGMLATALKALRPLDSRGLHERLHIALGAHTRDDALAVRLGTHVLSKLVLRGGRVTLALRSAVPHAPDTATPVRATSAMAPKPPRRSKPAAQPARASPHSGSQRAGSPRSSSPRTDSPRDRPASSHAGSRRPRAAGGRDAPLKSPRSAWEGAVGMPEPAAASAAAPVSAAPVGSAPASAATAAAAAAAATASLAPSATVTPVAAEPVSVAPAAAAPAAAAPAAPAPAAAAPAAAASDCVAPEAESSAAIEDAAQSEEEAEAPSPAGAAETTGATKPAADADAASEGGDDYEEDFADDDAVADADATTPAAAADADASDSREPGENAKAGADADTAGVAES